MAPLTAIEPSVAAGERPGKAKLVIRRVGVIGLGNMGNAFAVNLVQDGYEVLVFDSDRERATALESAGAVAATGLRDLAVCDVVVTSLPNDDALGAVALGAAGAWSLFSPRALSTSPQAP